MKAVMSSLGIVMRQKCCWVKSETKMYVVMDNAGGHETDEKKNIIYIPYHMSNTTFSKYKFT